MRHPGLTFLSYCLAAKTLLFWHRAGIIDLGCLDHLLDIACVAKDPGVCQAARRVIGLVGYGDLVGERRTA